LGNIRPEELKRTIGDSEWVFAGNRQSSLSAHFGHLGAVLKQATRVGSAFTISGKLRHRYRSPGRGSARYCRELGNH
jgi:hypothetical protein